MTESGRNFGVGLFVLTSLVVVGTLMVWFGEVPDWLRRGEWMLQIKGVEELRGIGEGATVRLNGVEIGRVRNLDFVDPARPDKVVINALIRDRFTVPQGAKARVYGATLGFGSGHIEIIPDPRYAAMPIDRDGAFIQGEMRSLFGEIISKDFIDSVQRTVTNIGNVAAAATPVMENINKIVERRTIAEVGAPGAADRGVVANLSTVVERIDQLVANVNEVLGDKNVQDDVKLAVRDLKTATEDLKATLALWKSESQKVADNLNGGILRTEENLNRSFGKLNNVLDHLDQATDNLAGTLQGVRDGKGTLGLLATDPRLYEAAVLSLQRLSDVLADFKVVSEEIKQDGSIPIRLGSSGLIKTRIPLKEQSSNPN